MICTRLEPVPLLFLTIGTKGGLFWSCWLSLKPIFYTVRISKGNKSGKKIWIALAKLPPLSTSTFPSALEGSRSRGAQNKGPL